MGNKNNRLRNSSSLERTSQNLQATTSQVVEEVQISNKDNQLTNCNLIEKTSQNLQATTSQSQTVEEVQTSNKNNRLTNCNLKERTSQNLQATTSQVVEEVQISNKDNQLTNCNLIEKTSQNLQATTSQSQTVEEVQTSNKNNRLTNCNLKERTSQNFQATTSQSQTVEEVQTSNKNNHLTNLKERTSQNFQATTSQSQTVDEVRLSNKNNRLTNCNLTETDMDRHYDELLVELECPICMTYMAPPIRQCTTGHSICEPCRRKLPMCPLCQGPFTDTKNISLEALARKMHYPCANYKTGCAERLTLDERENHERECSYKGYKCSYSKCTWKGKYEDLLEHWSQKKISSRPYRSTNVCHTKIQKTEAFYVNMIQAYDELFWYKFRSSGGKMYWAVQYIGASEKANDYFFEIELFKPGQPIRRTLMSEYCQSVDIDNKDLFQAGNCVMTSMEAVNHFFGEDQLLIYYMRVKEVNEVERAPRDQSTSRDKNYSRDKSTSRDYVNNDFGRKDEGHGANRKHNFKGYNKRAAYIKKKPT